MIYTHVLNKGGRGGAQSAGCGLANTFELPNHFAYDAPTGNVSGRE